MLFVANIYYFKTKLFLLQPKWQQLVNRKHLPNTSSCCYLQFMMLIKVFDSLEIRTFLEWYLQLSNPFRQWLPQKSVIINALRFFLKSKTKVLTNVNNWEIWEHLFIIYWWNLFIYFFLTNRNEIRSLKWRCTSISFSALTFFFSNSIQFLAI